MPEASPNAPQPSRPEPEIIGFEDLRNLDSLMRSLEHTLAALNAQTDYSAVLSWSYRELLTAVARVDQKYGPYTEFAKWREQGYAS